MMTDSLFSKGIKPNVMQIELTNRCNEKCVHCYIPSGNEVHDMTASLFHQILEECEQMGIQKLVISGGEPMLHDDFCCFLEKATERGFAISIFSNLTIINDKIVETLKKSNIRDVQVSVYSLDPQVHDSITRLSGSHRITMNNIKRLLNEEIPVFISCPLAKENRDSYIEVLNWAKTLGMGCAPTAMITAISDFSLSNLGHRQSVDEAISLIHSILENDEDAYKHERFSPEYSNTNEFREKFIDIYGSVLAINPKGDIVPSPNWSYKLGNINDTHLWHIFESSPELDRILKLDAEDFPKCKDCKSIQFCGMSLGGNANENSGNYLIVPDCVCEVADKTRELVHKWWAKADVVEVG